MQDTAVSEGSTHPHLRAPEVGALTPCLVILPRSFLPRAFKRFARSFQRCLDRGDITLKLPLHPPAHEGQRQPQRPAELDTQELTSELRRSPTTRREMRVPATVCEATCPASARRRRGRRGRRRGPRAGARAVDLRRMALLVGDIRRRRMKRSSPAITRLTRIVVHYVATEEHPQLPLAGRRLRRDPGAMTAPEPADLWWVCCSGHVFRHPAVGEGEEIACPGLDEAACAALLHLPALRHRAKRGRRARRPSE